MINRIPAKSFLINTLSFLINTSILAAAATLLFITITSSLIHAQENDASEVTPINLYGLNYNTRQGPDWDPNKCKNDSQVMAELTLISKITNRIRILSCTDCLQGPVVLRAAKELEMELLFGLWVSSDTKVIENELACLEKNVNGFGDTVTGITVGSEAVYREEVLPEKSVEYLNATRKVLADAGRSDLSVSLCETDDTFQAYPLLMSTTDIVVANSFPIWELKDVSSAADYLVNSKLKGGWDVASQLGKGFILGETGWASDGSNPAASEASPSNQAKYFQDLFCLADRQEGWSYYYFCAFDTPWRIAQDGYAESIEGHFGLFYENLTLKEHFARMEFSCNGSDVKYGFVSLQTKPGSTPEPTPKQSPSPFPAFGVTDTTCAGNPACKELNLTGDCCPNENGEFLLCCSDIPTSSPSMTATATTSFPTPVPSALHGFDETASSDVPSYIPSDSNSITSDTPSISSSDAPSVSSSYAPSVLISDAPSGSSSDMLSEAPSNITSDVISMTPSADPLPPFPLIQRLLS